jgi:hypothetical protein
VLAIFIAALFLASWADASLIGGLGVPRRIDFRRRRPVRPAIQRLLAAVALIDGCLQSKANC